jgi:hypothetical protein
MAIQPYENGPLPMPCLPESRSYCMDDKLFLYKANALLAILTLSDFFMEKQVHQVGEYDFY